MLDELTQELARLYADSDSARRVAADAGIPEQFVEFDGPAIDAWRRIVDQADKRGVLANLLRVVTKDYSNNSKLQRMYGAFLYDPRTAPEGPLIVGQGRETRNDLDALARLERSISRIDQIINGTEWNKGDDGLLTVVKQIRAEVTVLKEDVDEMKRAWSWMRWAIYVLLPVVAIIGVALILALAGIWGNAG